MIKINQVKNEIKELKSHDPSINTKEIENIINEFNVFNCLDFTFKERVHSKFLAWILNPKGNHGFEDFFLNEFISSINNLWDLSKNLSLGCFINDTNVQLEANFMDILITNTKHKFVIVIENKILAPEGKKQLINYKNNINNNQKYNNYEKTFIFLTPEGRQSKTDPSYISIGYEKILDILKKTLNNFKCSSENKVIDFLKDYISILDNHIIPKTKIEQILEKIDPQKEAKQYVDTKFKTIKNDVKKYIQSIIQSDSNLKLIKSPNSMIRFTTKSIRKIINLLSQDDPEYVFYFEFNNQDDLEIKLVLIPGTNSPEIRKKIFNLAKNDKTIFCGVRLNKVDKLLKEQSKTLEGHIEFLCIFKDIIITKEEYRDFEIDQIDSIKDMVNYKFQIFKENKLNQIENKLLEVIDQFQK